MSACYTHNYPGYVIWGRTQKCPSAGLANFLDCVTEYFDVRDDTPISVTKRDTPLSYMPLPEPFQPEVQTAASGAASSEGPVSVGEVVRSSAGRAATRT